MTYEEVVWKIREGYEFADAREIYEHVAVQANIYGEGAGAFYIEIANRAVSVEPYDYVDRDGLITADAATYVALAEGKMTIREAVDSGRLKVEGNMDKMRLFHKVKLNNKEEKKKRNG